MKKNLVFMTIASLVLMAWPSCSNGGNSTEHSTEEAYGTEEVYGYEQSDNSQSSTQNITFYSENDVRSNLSGRTFRDDEGNRIEFRGFIPMEVYFNGQMLSTNMTVKNYGKSDDGNPCAVIRVSGPAGSTTLVFWIGYGQYFLQDTNDGTVYASN